MQRGVWFGLIRRMAFTTNLKRGLQFEFAQTLLFGQTQNKETEDEVLQGLPFFWLAQPVWMAASAWRSTHDIFYIRRLVLILVFSSNAQPCIIVI